MVQPLVAKKCEQNRASGNMHCRVICKMEFSSGKRLGWPGAAPHVYVNDEVSDDVSVIDASTFTVNPIHLGQRTRGIHRSPDGRKISIVLSGNPIGGPRVDESKPSPPDKSPDAIAEFDVATQISRMLQAGSDPKNCAVVPDGEAIYVSNEGSKLYVSTGRGKMVFVIDTATNKPMASFEVGQRPWGITLSADGKTLYSANGPSNDVSVVDLSSNKVLRKVPTGQGPWGVIVLNPK